MKIGKAFKRRRYRKEKILESFGYKMIRLNRFNVGLDPVKYIDKMLAERLSDLISSNKQHDIINEINLESNELYEEVKKKCRKCEKYLSLKFFEDNKTKQGYSRICKDCKKQNNSRKSVKKTSETIKNKSNYQTELNFDSQSSTTKLSRKHK